MSALPPKADVVATQLLPAAASRRNAKPGFQHRVIKALSNDRGPFSRSKIKFELIALAALSLDVVALRHVRQVQPSARARHEVPRHLASRPRPEARSIVRQHSTCRNRSRHARPHPVRLVAVGRCLSLARHHFSLRLRFPNGSPRRGFAAQAACAASRYQT
jgi:hypothetical protein